MSDGTPPVDLSQLTATPTEQPLGDFPPGFGVPDHEAGAAAEVPPPPDSGKRRGRLRSISGGNARTDKGDTAAIPVPDKPRPGSLVPQLESLYAGIGMALLPFDPVCGQAVINASTACAETLENLARENPAVRRAILRLVATSVWGQVIAAHMPILIVVASHHGNVNIAAMMAGMERVQPTEEPPPNEDDSPKEHVRA